jgi:hypothetical protein
MTVRFWPLAGTPELSLNVRFRGKADIEVKVLLPLLTKAGISGLIAHP